MRKSEIIVILIVLFSFLIGLYFYPKMPEKIASHWNARGEVDGYMSKFWGIFLMPFVLIGLFFLFFLMPRIDPLRGNIKKFRKYYDGFIILFFIFMLSIFFHIILWNLGTKIKINLIFPVGIAVLFFYVGILCDNAKRNWFIGIRTPWTLSSDVVWDKTHKIGGILFKIAGLIAALGIFFENLAIYFVLIPVISVAIFTLVYSYFEYQNEMRKIGHE
jgi:uncharacterized membrane protein